LRTTHFVLALLLAVLPVGSSASVRRPTARISRLAHADVSKVLPIQLAKLTAADSLWGNVGFSVAVSGDAIVVGASFYNEGNTAVYVYVKPERGWRNMTPTAELKASDGAALYSVAMNGNTIVAGSGYEHRKMYLYLRPPTGWKNMTETAILTASDARPRDCFGCSLSIDGDTVVAGALRDHQYVGSAYVYVKPPGGWKDMTETAKLTASDGVSGDDFGYAVGISGGTVVVGAPQISAGYGKGYVFVKPSAGWTNMTQTAELTPSNGGSQLYFGSAAVVNRNTVLISEPSGHAAYVFVKPKAGWQDMHETAELTDPNASYSFGNSLALQGGIALVGDGNTDATFVYVEPKSGWKTTSKSNATITGSDARYNSTLGVSVGMSGKIIVAGAPGAGVGYKHPGAAYVFTLP